MIGSRTGGVAIAERFEGTLFCPFGQAYQVRARKPGTLPSGGVLWRNVELKLQGGSRSCPVKYLYLGDLSAGASLWDVWCGTGVRAGASLWDVWCGQAPLRPSGTGSS